MNDFNQVEKAWEQAQQERKAKLWAAAQPLLLRLKKAGVEELTITYSGSDDSGSWNDIYSEPEGLIRLNSAEEEALVEYALNCLPSGWEINEGSKGSILFNLQAQTISLDHYEKRLVYSDEDSTVTNFTLE